MKTPIHVLLAIAVLALATRGFSADAPQPTGKTTTAAATDPATYPLTTCVVSGEPLEGGMGGPVDYIHKEAGKPDRLVRFCCKACIKEFKKEPAKYLAMIDAAAGARSQ